MLAENKLFATLDPTTRRLRLPTNQNVLLTDTVGFIRKLPHGLVEAFKATLEEARANLREAAELTLEANRALTEEDLAGADVIREPLKLTA